MPIRNSTMRDYVDPVTNTLGLLETGQPLPDDDPKTRNGGLNPARQQDSGQINMYMKLRQSGQISDIAWSRLIQRNPKAATLLSVIGPTPEAAAAKNRNEILSRYFSPEQEAKPYSSEDVGSGVGPLAIGTPIPGTARPAKADQQNAINALLQAGDIEGAKQLLGVVSPRQGSKARPLQIQTIDERGNPTTVIVDPETLNPIREYPMVPKALGGQDIQKLSTAASIRNAFANLNTGFRDEYGGFKSRAIGEATSEYQSRFGDDSSSMVDWWQQYQDQKNRIRKELYGSALTETEAREFDKANIHPGMKPAQIRANLARQSEINQQALDKLAAGYSGRYDQRQISGAVGKPPANTPQSAPQPKRLKYNPSTGRIE